MMFLVHIRHDTISVVDRAMLSTVTVSQLFFIKTRDKILQDEICNTNKIQTFSQQLAVSVYHSLLPARPPAMQTEHVLKSRKIIRRME